MVENFFEFLHYIKKNQYFSGLRKAKKIQGDRFEIKKLIIVQERTDYDVNTTITSHLHIKIYKNRAIHLRDN